MVIRKSGCVGRRGQKPIAAADTQVEVNFKKRLEKNSTVKA